MISGANSVFKVIRCEDDADWLAQRTKGVGGSGLSPWRTPADVWFEKTGRADPQDISDRPNVRRGVELEPFVGGKFAAAHQDFIVRRVNAICQSMERPWAQASLDYEVCEHEVTDRRSYKWGVLEIKTARSDADWKEGIPAYYLTQVTHYLSVTGRDFAWLAVQFCGDHAWEYREYRVERDEEDIAAVNESVDTFWHDFVEADVMPELVGTASEAQGLTQAYHEPTDELVSDYDADTLQLVSDYQDAAERERQAKADKQRASTLLMAKIGDAKGIVTETARVTWSRSETESLDVKRLKAEAPEIWEQYARKQIRNGGLRVTDIK